VLRSARTFHVPGRHGWLLPWEHAIDIDTDDDWRLAEMLLARASDAGSPVRREIS
jgi:CMP-N-acetylneuraminic acid synthetase